MFEINGILWRILFVNGNSEHLMRSDGSHSLAVSDWNDKTVYLSDIPKKVTNITFTPKAEEQCLSVACASIISRYIFLREMYKMSEELGKDIPKGAGINVDEFVQELVNEKGKDILTNYVKLNFKNTEKIK